MNALSAADLLDAWERGLSCSTIERALLLLAAACPETPLDALARLSIGRRDGLLLTLRERSFGERLVCLAVCPDCGERLEMTFGTNDIRAETASEPPGEMTIQAPEHVVRFRLPNSNDLATLTDVADAATARRWLLDRCVVSATRDEQPSDVASLPEEVAAAIAARMAESDPQADVRLALDCPACRRAWQAPFDVVSFFWTEIDAWARRLLREVSVLAKAYGWREADILALSPLRRQMYLDMVNG